MHIFKPAGLQAAPDLFLFNYDDTPEKSFLYSGGNVVEADREIQLILEKTKSHTRTNTLVVEVIAF